VTEPSDTGDVDPPRLFVYGTLQPGRLRWPFLEPYAIGHRPAIVSGRIYDSGRGWPAAVFGRAGAHVIPGSVVDLDPRRAPEGLELLDEVESSVDGLFIRVSVETASGERAWAYEWARVLDGLTRIDRWHDQDEA
jgi:gamma-glutamylcyclotransferase (GGCT)/AIG2-like uncharacterized protein YtfP